MITHYVLVDTRGRRPYTVRDLKFATREEGEAYIKARNSFFQSTHHVEGRVAKKDNSGERMHCQCCGRAIMANIGMSIAHHGYERPDAGYQTSSCYGARAYPFEVSRGKLGELIQHLCEQNARMVVQRDEVEAETQPIRISWKTSRGKFGRDGHDFHYFDLTRENFDTAEGIAARRAVGTYQSFDDIKARDLKARNNKIISMNGYIREQQERYDLWVQTHKPLGKTYVKI